MRAYTVQGARGWSPREHSPPTVPERPNRPQLWAVGQSMPPNRPRQIQNSASDPDAVTSIHVQRAKHGDEASLDWIVRRFTPLLLAQARYRLGASLRAHYDP